MGGLNVMPYTLADAEAEAAAAMRAEDWGKVNSLAPVLDRLAAAPAATLLGAALWYAEQGLHVFPLQPNVKVPHPGTRGCKDATTDPEQVRAWWQQWPNSNVGIATGHTVDVIDFDGLPGHVSWGKAFPDPADPWGGAHLLGTVSTPRPGGLHAYVPATGYGNRAGGRKAMPPGVDYRGLGGYVLAPPSVLDARPGQHPGTYRFLRPLTLHEGPP